MRSANDNCNSIFNLHFHLCAFLRVLCVLCGKTSACTHVISLDKNLTPTDLLPQAGALLGALGRVHRGDRGQLPARLGVARVHRRTAATRPAAGPSGRRAFSTARRCCSSTPPDDERYLELGRERTVHVMAPHLTHVGVHDHGFNNVSTYGNLWRLMQRRPHRRRRSGKRRFYELALKASGAVQAARWSKTADGTGYIYSFNGPQSLFVDTIRSCRSLALAHQLGHALMGERDETINLLQRLVEHATNTARFNIWYGEGRDAYDVAGRTAHERVFNTNNGDYRCPSSQQGYSPFSTWTRGLAWAMLGFAEQLEWLATRSDDELRRRSAAATRSKPTFLKAARATCDFYIRETPTDGIPYWDTGAPGLAKLGDYLDRPADPFNDYEPVDSSAAAIACAGPAAARPLPRPRARRNESRRPLRRSRPHDRSTRCSTSRTCRPTPKHQGLILHSVYHRPNGWDYIPPGRNVPCGESSMWGDYHAREAALYVERLAENAPYYTFFGPARRMN